MKKLSIILLLLFVFIHAQAANVTGSMTNAVTGLPDTNAIKIFAVRPFIGANGSYNTVGPPILINPNTNGFWEITNMPAGMFIANNAFISGGWINGSYQAGNFVGPSQVGGPSGVMFWVDTTTNTYPFTTYPVSYGNGIYNVFNFVQGITSVYLTNGFSGGVTNNVLYLNGAGFTAVITFAALTNALGYIPANTNSFQMSIQFTNSFSAIGGNILYWQTNYDGYGSWLIAQQNSTNFALNIGLNGTNNINASNTLYQTQFAAQTAALALTNAIIQLQITLTTNQLAALIVNEHNYAVAISNLFALGSNNLQGFTLAVSNYNQILTYTIGLNGTNNLNASNTVYQLQFTTWGNNDTNQSFAAAKQATNTLANNFIAWSTAAFDPINSAQFATNLLKSAAWQPIAFFVTNIPASGGSTNFLGTRTDGSEVVIPWSGIPSGGGGGGSGGNVFSNTSPVFSGLSVTNGGVISGRGDSITNLPVNQGGYIETTNPPTLSNATNIIAANSGGQVSIPWLSLPYDPIGLATSSSNTVQQSVVQTNVALALMVINASNVVNVSILNLGTALTNNVSTTSNILVLANHFINSVTNGQSTVNFGIANISSYKTVGGNLVIDGSGNIFLNNSQNLNDSTAQPGVTDQFLGNNSGLPVWSSITIGNVSGLTANFNSTTNTIFAFGLQGTNNTTAVSNILQLAINTIGLQGTNNTTAVSNILQSVINIIGLNGTNNTTAVSNILQAAILTIGLNGTNNGTVISNAVVALIAGLASTNGPTIWNPTFHTVVNIGGNPYQTETNGVIGITNGNSVDIGINGTYLKFSSTQWYQTNNPIWTISTNGAVCLYQSNSITIATSTTLGGAMTLINGTGNTPGNYIGSIINLIGVEFLGVGIFPQGIMAGSFQDSVGTFPASTNIATFGGLNGKTLAINITGNSGSASSLSGSMASANYISVNALGAFGDEQTITDAVMLATSANIFSKSMPFAPADSGKAVEMFGIGSNGTNGAVSLTILSYINASNVTASAAATFSTTNRMDWGHDDTIYWSNAVQQAAISGQVITAIPSRYFIDGAFNAVPNTSPQGYAQLTVPIISIDSAVMRTVEIDGFMEPAWNLNNIQGDSQPMSTNGVVLISSRYPPHPTVTPEIDCMLGVPTPTTVGQTITAVNLVLKNITVRGYNQCKTTLIDAGYIGTLTAQNILIDGGTLLSGLTVSDGLPTYGLVVPRVNNWADTRLDNIIVFGLQTAFNLSEHVDANQIQGVCCHTGVELPGSFHAINISRLITQECQNGIYASGGNSGFPNQAISISEWDYENANFSGRLAYLNTVNSIYDSGTYINGFVGYHGVTAGSGWAPIPIGIFGTSSSLTIYSLQGGQFFTTPIAPNIKTLGTHTPGQVTIGTSPFTFVNPQPYNLECNFSGSVAYSISKNGVAVYGSLAGDAYVMLQTNCSLTISYASAPTLYTNAW